MLNQGIWSYESTLFQIPGVDEEVAVHLGNEYGVLTVNDFLERYESVKENLFVMFRKLDRSSCEIFLGRYPVLSMSIELERVASGIENVDFSVNLTDNALFGVGKFGGLI